MKISEITINNYRAFYNENGEEYTRYHFDLGNGKNLLIYGENGSGKSSLYKGLRDLFRSSVEPDCRLTENIFSRELELKEPPFVGVRFTEGETKEYYYSADTYITNTGCDMLRSVSRSRSFMTYRDLMRIHFIDDPEVNLFDFLFGNEGLLTELPNPVASHPETNLKIGELLQVIREKPDKIKIQDFTNGVKQILADLNKSLNCLLRYFDKSLEVAFTELDPEAVEKGELIIKLEVTYFGKTLNGQNECYHHFLNEARLSALAICIFLAAHLSVPPPFYEILFLDDIFTGLDTSNRIPLLRILTDPVIKDTDSETFVNHQIILTTYDRQWYELAKNYLGTSDWCFQEMYICHHEKGFDHPALLPGEDDLEKAWHYFQLKQYPACANYQRKVCEGLIKKFLPDCKKYDSLPNGDIVPVSKLDTLITRLEGYLRENKLSFEPFKELKICLRVVMNPLSHDDWESPVFGKELEMVFQIIERLRKLQNIIVLKSGEKIRMRKIYGPENKEREYICQLVGPIRKISNGEEWSITDFEVLPLTQKDGDEKKKLSYCNKFLKVYNQCCHSMGIEKAENPYTEFELMDGTSLNDLIEKA